MLRNIFQSRNVPELVTSTLFNQDTFYRAFDRDISGCRRSLVIESPFITRSRMNSLLPILTKLRRKNVQVIVNTRNPEEHDGIYQEQAENAVDALQSIGVTVLYTVKHHRKIAIIDSTTLWEGSLNILSFNDSCEVMRRIQSPELARQMAQFIKIEPHLVQ